MMVSKTIFAAGVSAFAMLAATTAYAQESVDAVDSGQIIVVTAQKREQRLIDVPMAVSVLGGEDLERRGIDNVQDLSFAVPGLTMREDGPGSYTIFLRGLANQSGSGALVSMYLDEAPLSLSGYDQLSPVPLDFARVEVLKGPQGTLYGQGSAGGTVRFVTNDPNTSQFEGKLEGEVYNVASGELGTKLSGVLNTPWFWISWRCVSRVPTSRAGAGSISRKPASRTGTAPSLSMCGPSCCGRQVTTSAPRAWCRSTAPTPSSVRASKSPTARSISARIAAR